MIRRAAPLLALLALASSLPAQTGPWTDGELLVRSVLSPTSQTQAIYRIVPETGDGELLISGTYWAGSSSSMVYDPYRDAVIASTGLAPNLFTYEMRAISWDGTATTIPGFTGEFFRAFTPVGDGRLYFQQTSNNPNNEIHYLDASNVEHTLMDQSGTSPFQFSVERMLWHAPTNSLIACTSGWYSSNNCTPNLTSFFRIPLTPDGSRVSGPITCASLSVSNVVMGMDYMPNGDIMLALAGSQFYSNTLLRMNPQTLTATFWAAPSIADIDGGFWSSRIGKAIILDDTNNVLRAYSPGQSGGGQIITADVTVSANTVGYSTTESMVRIDTNGPGCHGVAAQFGAGVAGTGGFVPNLGVIGCPDVGSPFSLSITEARGGTSGVLAVGDILANIPALGGTVYVFPYQVLLPLTLGGAPGAGGAGALGLPLQFTSPALIGFSFYLQGAFIDPIAVQGITLTNGLQLTVGG